MRFREAWLALLLAGCADVYERRVIARDLNNPRGVLREADGSILVAEAGTGRPGSGRLLRISRDGVSVLIDGQPSVNILRRLAVHRDEIFGLADVAAGDGTILATVADPLEGSRVLRIDGSVWSAFPGNANSLTFDPGRRTWFAVSSFANALLEIAPGRTREVVRFPPLEQGQDAVPAAVEYDNGTLLVALFGGQVGGDTGGSGVDFVKDAGRVVRVDPDRGSVEVVARGFNAPIDIAVSREGLYVLEFCARYLDPIDDEATCCHGGFERFSGRLVLVSPDGRRHVLARGLDLPTNLHVSDEGILVTEGQGTPGRPIPGPDGPTRIEGRLIELKR